MKKHTSELVRKNLSENQKLARRQVCFETLENCSRFEIFKTEGTHKSMAIEALLQTYSRRSLSHGRITWNGV